MQMRLACRPDIAMEVIDIPSSPDSLVYESRITRRQGRQPLSQRKAPLSPTRQVTGEIIEISDSDSESAPKLVPLKKKNRPENHAQDINEQHSESSFSHVPVIVAPPVNLLQVAAPSAGSSQNARVDAVPLFYADDEDLEGVRERVVPNQGLERTPPPILPVVLPPALPPQTLEPLAPAVDPSDACVARVLEIVPDVQPAHVLGLVEQFIHLPNNTGQNFLELVLHSLFENPDYPKVDRKGKRKRTEDDEEGSTRGQPVPKIDYGAKDREYKGGLYYFELALVCNYHFCSLGYDILII